MEIVFDIEIKDNDEKVNDILKNLINEEVEAYVGIFAEDNPEVAKRAIYNEMGTSTAPARPFVEPTIIKNTNKIEKTISTSILKKFVSANQVINEVADNMVLETKKTIDRMKSPPLSKHTIKKKGHKKLLKDTEEMYESITKKVFVKKGDSK